MVQMIAIENSKMTEIGPTIDTLWGYLSGKFIEFIQIPFVDKTIDNIVAFYGLLDNLYRLSIVGL